MRLAVWLARRAWIEVHHAVVIAGYAVRPYDMLADRRRWFWQPRARCGWPAGTPRWVVDDVAAAVEKLHHSREAK